MSTVYENMKRLATLKTKIGWGTIAELHGNGEVSLVRHKQIIATITPQNLATLYNSKSQQRVNIIYGMLGLGAIVNGATSKARLVYWLNGMTTRYTLGMQIDLNTSTAIGAIAIEDLTTDVRARNALLKLIRSKIPVAKLFLRMNDTIPDVPMVTKEAHYTPSSFLEAIRENDVPHFAHTPILMNRGQDHKRTRCSKEETYEQFLDAYINQNRAELYRLGGVTK